MPRTTTLSRPDLWSHLAFGRGYGTYDHHSYRVLDSEFLSRVVDTGIVGTLALVFMLLSIVFAARPLITKSDPVGSPVALMVAASAVAYLVLTFLFDVSSFPHVPYILLALAGLLAVAITERGRTDPACTRVPCRGESAHRRARPRTGRHSSYAEPQRQAWRSEPIRSTGDGVQSVA